MLENAKNDLIECICEISLNVLKATAPISRQSKKRLTRHKTSLRKLVDRKLSLKKKRNIIQSGDFLPALLGAVIPILGGLFGLAK